MVVCSATCASIVLATMGVVDSVWAITNTAQTLHVTIKFQSVQEHFVLKYFLI